MGDVITADLEYRPAILIAQDFAYALEHMEEIKKASLCSQEIANHLEKVRTFPQAETIRREQERLFTVSLMTLCIYLIKTNKCHWANDPAFYAAVTFEFFVRFEKVSARKLKVIH